MHINASTFLMLIGGSAVTMATAFVRNAPGAFSVTPSQFPKSGSSGPSIPYSHGQPNRQLLMMGLFNDLFQGPQVTPREEILKLSTTPRRSSWTFGLPEKSAPRWMPRTGSMHQERFWIVPCWPMRQRSCFPTKQSPSFCIARRESVLTRPLLF
jgi:hypothetical protein